MSRHVLALVVAVCAVSLLAGCGERPRDAAASAARASSGSAATPAAAPVATKASTGIALVGYLRGAEIQAETDAQRETLRKALRDLQALPAAEMRAARYAGADGRPARRDVIQVLRAHLLPPAPQGLEMEPLLVDRETDAGRAALRETLAKLDPPKAK